MKKKKNRERKREKEEKIIRRRPRTPLSIVNMADHERIRLVVLGGAAVGKSAIIRRLLGQGFSERYRPTVEDLYSRECVLGNLTLKVDLLDTTGKYNIKKKIRLISFKNVV